MKSGWSSRPFARTFDLLASEYGWTDDQILDLTMTRIRQCRDVIVERMDEDRKRELRTREIELQQQCAFIAGAAGWKKGVGNARKIKLYERTAEERPLPRTEKLLRALTRAR